MVNDLEFRFTQARNLGVFICPEVAAGAPILRVSHDADGDWQFLCGGDHSESRPKLVCLEHVVAGDPSLNEVADLCRNHSAERDAGGRPWIRFDHTEEDIIEAVREHGWFVALFDDEGKGSGSRFAYSIGMLTTLDHPEVIIVGQPPSLMHFMINEIGNRAKRGEPCPLYEPIEGLIEGFSCVLKPMASGHHNAWLGYGRWFHKKREFPVLQCFWPDKEGHFPWESTYTFAAESQVDLSHPPEGAGR